MWRCTVCGYVFEGYKAPDKCPKCGAPKKKFKGIDEEEAALITRSRHTNHLHMKLSTFLRKVEWVSESGIEDNLDPGCLAIFRKAKEQALELRQMINAELQTHMKKGKWG
jgi:rubredoxin